MSSTFRLGYLVTYLLTGRGRCGSCDDRPSRPCRAHERQQLGPVDADRAAKRARPDASAAESQSALGGLQRVGAAPGGRRHDLAEYLPSPPGRAERPAPVVPPDGPRRPRLDVGVRRRYGRLHGTVERVAQQRGDGRRGDGRRHEAGQLRRRRRGPVAVSCLSSRRRSARHDHLRHRRRPHQGLDHVYLLRTSGASCARPPAGTRRPVHTSHGTKMRDRRNMMGNWRT